MADRDRIRRLEYDSAQLARQTAGPPVRIGDSGGDEENFRLIRGQAVGAVLTSDPDFYIDNVVVLSGGLDPSGGNPATQVLVQNVFSQAYSDNEMVDAVYSPEVATGVDWETLKASAGSEQYRLIKGQAVGAVTADDPTFNIDGILVRAGGLDPRTVPGDAAETLSITNTFKQGFIDNEYVMAIYRAIGGWEVLAVERYRALHGTYYSTPGAGYAAIKLTAILDDGLDPRTDPTDADEQVVVKLPTGTTFSGSDLVWADYAPGIGTSGGNPVNWLTRPKATDGASGTFTAVLSGTISAGTTTAMASSTATIRSIGENGVLTSEGTRAIYNPFPNSLPASFGGVTAIYTCAKTWDDPEDEADDEYTIVGIDVLNLLASLTGFGEKKALAVPESGTDSTDIQWLGAECEE